MQFHAEWISCIMLVDQIFHSTMLANLKFMRHSRPTYLLNSRFVWVHTSHVVTLVVYITISFLPLFLSIISNILCLLAFVVGFTEYRIFKSKLPLKCASANSSDSVLHDPIPQVLAIQIKQVFVTSYEHRKFWSKVFAWKLENKVNTGQLSFCLFWYYHQVMKQKTMSILEILKQANSLIPYVVFASTLLALAMLFETQPRPVNRKM
jgi:hypothetical protein